MTNAHELNAIADFKCRKLSGHFCAYLNKHNSVLIKLKL